MIWPLIALSNIAQGSAAFAIFVLFKNDDKIKSMSLSASLSAWLGVTEPAMFGINLKYKYAFYGAIIGSAIASGVSTMFGVVANSIGIGGLPGFLAIKPQFWIPFIMCMAIAVIVPFVLTMVFSKTINKESK